jgi:hypothetical protein
MDPIDLSLAINYLPACACLGKVCWLAFALCVVHAWHAFPAYAAVGAGLLVDRLVYPTRIMDSNAVLLAVLCSHLVWEVRRAGEPRWEPGLPLALGAAWCAQGGWCLWDRHGSPSVCTRARNHQLAFASTAALASLSAFLHAEDEIPMVRAARYVTYASLSLCWMYMLGLFRRRLTHPADSGVHFAVYFSPVLYVHQYVALLYSAFCLVSVAIHLRPPSQQQPRAPSPSAAPETPSPPEEDLAELERVYRLAIGDKGSV